MTSAANLKAAQLLFEPKPLEGARSPRKSDGPSARRRVQSAKERRWANVHQEGTSNERPRSAAPSCEKTATSKLRRPPSGKNGRLLSGHVLTLDLEEIATGGRKKKTSRPSSSYNSSPVLRESVVPESTVERSPSRTGQKGQIREIPSGIAALEPWLIPTIEQRLIGVDPCSCLVFLPSLVDCDDLPVVPPVQDATDELPFTTTVKQEVKPYDPKKLFHYNVLKNRPRSADHVCNHGRKEDATDVQRIFGSDGKLLHDGSQYHSNRTKDVIKREIEDLERLLQGIGREDSTNIVVQYQHDINMLQKSLKETFSQHIRPKEKSEPPLPDLTGLRAFLKEKERINRRIKDRRERCMEELDVLGAGELSIKVAVVPLDSNDET